MSEHEKDATKDVNTRVRITRTFQKLTPVFRGQRSCRSSREEVSRRASTRVQDIWQRRKIPVQGSGQHKYRCPKQETNLMMDQAVAFSQGARITVKARNRCMNPANRGPGWREKGAVVWSRGLWTHTAPDNHYRQPQCPSACLTGGQPSFVVRGQQYWTSQY